MRSGRVALQGAEEKRVLSMAEAEAVRRVKHCLSVFNLLKGLTLNKKKSVVLNFNFRLGFSVFCYDFKLLIF